VTDIAKLILDADTTGLVKANTALRDVSQAAKTTAQDVSALSASFNSAGVGVTGFMNGAQRAKVGMQDIEKTSGSARQGMQQLGYQLGDIATLFSLGAKPAQIFASQIGQITQAVQLMAGGTSRVAAFLSGPWGIALSVGVIALAPFIGKLFDAKTAAEEMGDAAAEAMAKLNASLVSGQSLTSEIADTATKRLLTNMGALAKANRELRLAQNPDDARSAEDAQNRAANLLSIQRRRDAAQSEILAAQEQLNGIRSASQVQAIQAAAQTRQSVTAAAGITSVSRALKSANDNAVSFKDNMQSAMDTLAQFKREMQDAGLFVGGRDTGISAVNRIMAQNSPAPDMARMNAGLTALYEKTEEARNRTETGTKAIADSFRTMATDALAALDRLAAGIESGNFLSILSGVVDIGLQLGGMGVFGKETQANILSSRGRANGGSVSAGRAYVVGENRPEVFIPDTNGRIQPSVGSGGGQVIVINNSALADVYVDGRVQAAAPAIVSASANYTQSTMARRSTRRVA